jgi:hypothetical protein
MLSNAHKIEVQPSDARHVLGSLAPAGLWVAQAEAWLVFINPYRAFERVHYEQLLREKVLSSESLPQPLELNRELVGGDMAWEQLLSMETKSISPQRARVTDRNLVYNGFDLCIVRTESAIQIKVMGLPKLPYFGLSDLREVLVARTEGRANVGDDLYRPTKVCEIYSIARCVL